jgi:non-specific serine/threonine protein kinase/serine/threonine-protein kinase
MTPERWRRLDEVFHAAAALDGGARRAYVREACADDAELRAELERLLAAHDRAGAFIERPALASAAEWVDGAEPSEGRRIGAYRIVREIARGGMGTVFLAERADGQYEQRVAVKVIKRGMDTEFVLERFRAERQILASLDHPNIARLIDGGTTDDGLPYFAMEYIAGRPIDAWADERRLSVAERLRLFLQVCDAVAYAHQHLVVHRDIKPLNILVTPEGAPKLLDFGIAKVLHADPDARTSTVTGLRLLTPDYASPEQVEGRHATTASDVYSLGVVLYELLTGRSPYRPRSRAPLDVAEAVRTTEPQRPSAVVAERLRRRLRGDLDTIVLTALRKEPSRRYGSVEQLAGDVRRHLEGRPVLARPDTLRYRAGKFARRNRVAVAAGAVVLLALVGGTVATASQARAAREQARRAEAAQARAERRFADVRRLANTVLFDYHDAIKDLPGATPVRERLVRDALAYLDTLALDAREDRSLQAELAGAYRRVGDVQGGLAGANLGDTPGAIESYEKALRILEALRRADPASVQVRRDLAGLSVALGRVVWETGDVARSLEHGRRARALLEPLASGAWGDPAVRLELSAAHDLIGQLLLELGDVRGALATHGEDLRRLSEAPAAVRASPRLRRALSVTLQHLGDAQVEAGDLDAALASHRRSRALREALAAEFPQNEQYRGIVAASRYYEATVLDRMGRWRDALVLFRLNLADDSAAVAADPRNAQHRAGMAFSLARVGDMLSRLGAPAEALDVYRAALRIDEDEFRTDSTNFYKRMALIEVRVRVCTTLAELRRADAPAACARAKALAEGTTVDPSQSFPRSFVADALGRLGGAYDGLATKAGPGAVDRRGHLLAARDLYRRSRDIWADLTARRLVSPIDSSRLGAAERAVARSESALR